MRMLCHYLEEDWWPASDKEWQLTDYGFYWAWDDASYLYIMTVACMGGKPEIDMLIHSQAGWPELQEYLIAWRKDVLRGLRSLEEKELIVRNQVRGGPIRSRKAGEHSPNERVQLTEDGKLRARYEYNQVQCEASGGGCVCQQCRGAENWRVLAGLVPERYRLTQPLTDAQLERQVRQQERQELQDYWAERWAEQDRERKDKLARIGAIYEPNADGELQLVGSIRPHFWRIVGSYGAGDYR